MTNLLAIIALTLAILLIGSISIVHWLPDVKRRRIKRKKETRIWPSRYRQECNPHIRQRNGRAIARRIDAIVTHLDRYKEKAEEQDFKKARREWITILVIAATAIFALVSDVIFYRQLDAMQNDGRAWLGPTGAGIKPLALNEGIQITIRLANTGREPATDVSEFGDFKDFSASEWDRASDDYITTSSKKCLSVDHTDGGRTFFPTSLNSFYTVSFTTSDDMFPPERRIEASDGLIAGTSTVAFVGCFTYKSVNKIRHTSYCFYFNERKTDINILSYCKKGNDAD